MNLYKLYQIIRRFEGCVLIPYQDSGGIWTCGWGSTGWDVIPGKPWSQEYADKRLEQDATRFAAQVMRICPNSNSNQLIALCDFAYNVGINNLRASTLLRKFRRGDVNGAAVEIMKWVHCRGKVLPGLVRRRAAEKLLLTGE